MSYTSKKINKVKKGFTFKTKLGLQSTLPLNLASHMFKCALQCDCSYMEPYFRNSALTKIPKHRFGLAYITRSTKNVYYWIRSFSETKLVGFGFRGPSQYTSLQVLVQSLFISVKQLLMDTVQRSDEIRWQISPFYRILQILCSVAIHLDLRFWAYTLNWNLHPGLFPKINGAAFERFVIITLRLILSKPLFLASTPKYSRFCTSQPNDNKNNNDQDI